MKKVLLSLSLLAMIGSLSLFTSCEKIKEKVKEEAGVDVDFRIDGTDATFEIPIITTLNETTYPDTASNPFDLDGYITAYSSMLGIGDVKSVTVTEAKLVFNNCDAENNASNFRTAMVAFYSNTNPELKWVATNDEVPDVQGAEIPLVPAENINLLDYLKTGTTVYYISGVNMRRATNKVLNATLKIKYHIQN